MVFYNLCIEGYKGSYLSTDEFLHTYLNTTHFLSH